MSDNSLFSPRDPSEGSDWIGAKRKSADDRFSFGREMQ